MKPDTLWAAVRFPNQSRQCRATSFTKLPAAEPEDVRTIPYDRAVRLLLTILFALSAATLCAQQAPVLIEHGVYDVHLILHTIGSEEYRITRQGAQRQLTAISATNDRGMTRTVTTTVDFTADGTPIRLRQESTPPAGLGSDIAIGGPTVTAREATLSRTFAKPAIAFPGVAAMPASVQMMLIRYWETHGRPARLPILRASPEALPIEIRLVGHEAFTVHCQIVRLTRYTIANLIFGREILWMNDSNRVAAMMTFAGGLPQEFILDQYAPAFDNLVQSGVAQEMLDLAACGARVLALRSHRIRQFTRPDRPVFDDRE